MKVCVTTDDFKEFKGLFLPPMQNDRYESNSRPPSKSTVNKLIQARIDLNPAQTGQPFGLFAVLK